MIKAIAKPRIIYNEPKTGSFDIPGVVYRGETGTYRLFEEMTPLLTQGGLAELYDTEKQKGNPHPTDIPLFWAIAKRGFELRNESLQDSKRLRQFFRKGLRKYPNTLTRIVYSPKKDKIIHNYGTSDAYSVNGEFIGLDGWVKYVPHSDDLLKQLLGIRNADVIDDISQWINGTNTYICRLNSKPTQTDERVARFGTDDDGLDLGCVGVPFSEYPAFRVLRIA